MDSRSVHFPQSGNGRKVQQTFNAFLWKYSLWGGICAICTAGYFHFLNLFYLLWHEKNKCVFWISYQSISAPRLAGGYRPCHWSGCGFTCFVCDLYCEEILGSVYLITMIYYYYIVRLRLLLVTLEVIITLNKEQHRIWITTLFLYKKVFNVFLSFEAKTLTVFVLWEELFCNFFSIFNREFFSFCQENFRLSYFISAAITPFLSKSKLV